MSLAALIFDFDGTIAETERDGHRVAYNRAFAELGLPWDWSVERYGTLLSVAGGKERLMHFISTLPDAGTYDAAAVASSVHAVKARYFAELAPTLALRPGVERLIGEAKAAGLRVAIATTAHESGVRALLASWPQIRGAIDLIAAGDIVARKKPYPDIYQFVLRHFALAASSAVAFEDSAIGLQAARAAGIATIVAPSIYTQGENFTGASRVVDDLERVDLASLHALCRVGVIAP